MGDRNALADWRPKFAEWVEIAGPMLAEGKAKQAFGVYPWFSGEGDPFARLAGPASETRFGLVTTGGYAIEGEQEPFAAFPSFDDTPPRINTIPLDVDRSKLRIDHPGYDHRFAKEDINCNLPLDRLRELEDAGEIGSIAQLASLYYVGYTALTALKAAGLAQDENGLQAGLGVQQSSLP